MAEIVAFPDPGHYSTGQILTVKFPEGTRKAIVTRTDKAPVLTEVLAYDTGPITPNPPIEEGGQPPVGPSIERPFLVVTQDGRGNVVYDGGFPKFYNATLAKLVGPVGNQTLEWPTTLPTTFAELTAASKYMYNAFNFCANKRKVANGNRKVLLINNADKDYDYYILGSHYNPYPGQPEVNGNNGFKDTFDTICKIGGWEPTYYTYTGTKIDISYEELDKYTHIVFISSQGGGNAFRITDNFANTVALYRTTGNGVIIITDHTNFNFTSVEDALARSDGFVPDANLLASKYDCYFSGNVYRQPVQVGEIRRQIGLPGPPENHPLLDNLSDSEYIFAGGSESVIFPKIYTDEVVPTDKDLVVNMGSAGTYYVNVLVQLESGDIITKPMRFIIIDPSDITMHDSLNKTLGSSINTYKKLFDYTLQYGGTEVTTLRGEILRNGRVQGYFLLENNVITIYPFIGPKAPIGVNAGDVIGFRVTQPFEYNINTAVSIVDGKPIFEKSGSISTFLGAIKTLPNYSTDTYPVALADTVQTGNFGYTLAENQTKDLTGNWFEQMRRARKPFSTEQLIPGNLWIATNQADWDATKPESPVGAATIIANTNAVYFYCETCLDWRLHPDSASALFGLNRRVLDKRSGKLYNINNGNTTLVP